MSLFVDFVGLNTLIQDAITSSANYIGYPLTADVSSYYNLHFSLTNNGDYLAALNAHRNGPYGHPIFKQIRTSQNPLTRYQVANNIFSFVETPSREVVRTYGLDSTEATGSLTIETNVTQFDTITIGDGVTASKTYTFKLLPLLPTEIQIGGTALETLANVKAKIEADFNITVKLEGGLFTRKLTNKNRGKRGNFILESSFTSGDNSIIGFSGGQDARINQVEYINSRYGDIQRFDEVPISSKYFPLQFLFGVGIDNERIDNKEDLSIDNIERILLKSSYANEMGYFINDGINKYYNLSQVTEEDYEKIKEFYLNGGLDADDSPISTFEFMKYRETIFPREVNTYKAHVRQRTNYENNFWRDDKDDRITQSAPFDYTTRFSIWPLDASPNWQTKTAVHYGVLVPFTDNVTPGILQNYGSLVAENLNTSNIDAFLKVAPYYNRLHTLQYHVAADSVYFGALNSIDTSTVVGPTGMVIPETGSYSGVANAGDRFQGNALWQAGEQAGKNPFYSSYDYFIEELRGKGKDFSIVPEFRISDHVETLLESGSQTKILDFFEVTGGLASSNQSSEATFYETYSTTDFLKHFAKIKKDHQDFAEPSTIKLTCKGLKKFLAYDSFYPALRTFDLSQRFYNSYKNNVYFSRLGSTVNPVVTAAFEMQALMNPMYAPGIMFNSIKSGVACDYPLVLDNLEFYHATASSGATTEDEYLINNSRFDYRVPFEAIVEPEKYLANTELICNEPHPSGNIDGSSFWDGNGDVLYKKMSSNFCAEVGNFFLQNSSFTSISSLEQSNPNFGQAVSGTTYSMRVKMYRSMDRARLTYSGSDGFYMPPQDFLSGNVVPRETITMYSRPSAFGPPCAGVTASAGLTAGNDDLHIDSLKGYNFPFTPPYYHGQAWADISFTADETKKYTLSEIIAKSETTYLRADIESLEDTWGFGTNEGPQKTTGLGQPDDQVAINFNAMQLNSSVNLFSRGQIASINLENDISEQPVNITTDVTEDASARWIIQTKFETPILNFKDVDLIVSASGRLFTSQTPRGMWHQYGRLPTNDEGIFLSVEDIPITWYTNKLGQSPEDAKNNKSLVDLCGFSSTPIKLGQVASGRVIREAVVAVPFIEIGGEKKFFELDADNVSTARQYLRVEDQNKKGLGVPPGSGDLETLAKRTSPSVIDMVRKAKRYVFPPSMDFLNYQEVKPFSMYIFEFTHTLSQQDLADIWQNLPPSIGTSFAEAEASVSHPLLANELMGYGTGDDTTPKGGELPNKVRWMVFKVKQRANTNYFDKVVGVKGSPLTGQTISRNESLKVDQDLLSYNWPYDFFSLVELVKIDAEVTFSDLESQDGTTKNVPKGDSKREKSSRTIQQNPTVESTRNNIGRRGR